MAIAENVSGKELYEAIIHFEESEEAQEYYYKTMDMTTGNKNPNGTDETIRDRILKAYAILFCEDYELEAVEKADADKVAATADRLYINSASYDPQHWYRMKYHFPVIDEDNYDRFAGAQTTNGEIIASLWEDDGDPDKKVSYLCNLRQDLQNTFSKLKLNGIILKQRGSLAIAAERIECDLYDWLKNKDKSKYSYLGEYMNQYSWSEYYHSELDEIYSKEKEIRQ